ncbi:hypothetical protein [Nonomuraea sp. NPDC049141]|uniref:hypothetical protein n=1 Tax=Nonomuraea sp. NPDC049141 TaxID=3155500 RepID=UPI003402187F
MTTEMTASQAREIAEKALDAQYAAHREKLTDWLTKRIEEAAEDGQSIFLSGDADPWSGSDYVGIGFTVQAFRAGQKLI